MKVLSVNNVVCKTKEVESLDFKGCKFEGSLGKAKVKGGLRDAFITPEGYVWLTADYCIDPNSLVTTKEGVCKIKDLESMESPEVLTPKGFKRVLSYRNTGRKKKVVIKLKTGESIICSEDHKFLVKDEDKFLWKKVSEIKQTDIIWTKNMGTSNIFV